MLRLRHHPPKRCPRCDDSMTNVQGLDACAHCGWTDRAV